MNPTYPFFTSTFAFEVAMHLLQSTIFAGVAAMAVLALRNERAQVRYWLWLAASLKFLLPFSPLIAAGKQIGAWMPATKSYRHEMVTQIIAFHEVRKVLLAPAPMDPLVIIRSASLILPQLLFSAWAVGCLVVACLWFKRWLLMHQAKLAAAPVAITAQVKVMSTPALLEPGIFGVFRPVLLLPVGITERLTPSQMEAILAHEFCHVRRRDNLAAAIHMVVETLFWFHPLVWWLGSRLVEEREHACDEDVLQQGSEPEVYAESILRVCQFYLESPLVCASGVTGSDLKKRMERIMTFNIGPSLKLQLTAGKKLLLATLAGVALVLPVAYGIAQGNPQGPATAAASNLPPATKIEVATIKANKSGDGRVMFRPEPDKLNGTNIPLRLMVEQAFGVKTLQIVGAPDWMSTESFDIVAKADGRATPQELFKLLRPVLEERFKLKTHVEDREMPIYELVVAKGGIKFQESKPDEQAQMMMQMGPNGAALNARNTPIERFCDMLSRQVPRVVVDKTGLKGNYAFKLEFTPDNAHMMGPGGDGPGPETGGPGGAGGVSVFAALQEQLGLKLEARKGPLPMLIIDHVERVPTEN